MFMIYLIFDAPNIIKNKSSWQNPISETERSLFI